VLLTNKVRASVEWGGRQGQGGQTVLLINSGSLSRVGSWQLSVGCCQVDVLVCLHCSRPRLSSQHVWQLTVLHTPCIQSAVVAVCSTVLLLRHACV
jgi:hypothetical protein